jgi:O-antigen/teichoic acid export membrane protein
MARDRNHRIFLAAGTGLFQRFVQAGATVVIMPVLLKTLGAARFGVWGGVTSLAWLHGLVDMGVGAALVTLVASARALNRTAEVRSLVAGAIGLACALAAIVALAGTLLLTLAPAPKAGLYLIAVIAMALNIPLNAANSVWLGLQKGHVSGFWDLAQTLLTTAGLIVASMYSSDVRVFVGAVYGGLVLSNVASFVHLFLAHPELRRGGLSGLGPSLRNVADKGLSYFLLTIVCALTYLLDNVLALELLGPEAAARMAIALRICMTAWGLLEVMSLPLWPAFTEAAVRADRKWIHKSMLRSAALLVGAAAAGSGLLLLTGQRLFGWWLGPGLGIDVGLLAAIAGWVVAQAVHRVPNVFLNAMSIVRFQLVVSSVATLIAFALKFIFAARFGVAGILWGTTVSTLVIVVPANIWRIWKWGKSVQPPDESSWAPGNRRPAGETPARRLSEPSAGPVMLAEGPQS